MTETAGAANAGIKAGAIAAIVPLAAVGAAYATGSILILDYVHVLLGAIWTGVDVFLGLIFSNVISSVDAGTRQGISRRIMPMTLFFIPSASVAVPAAGLALALREGIFQFSPIFMAILAVGLLLVGSGFATIFPFSLKLRKIVSSDDASDSEVRSKLLVITRGAFLQMILQIAIISLMAYLVVYG